MSPSRPGRRADPGGAPATSRNAARRLRPRTRPAAATPALPDHHGGLAEREQLGLWSSRGPAENGSILGGITSEAELLRVADALGARQVAGWTPAESALLRTAGMVADAPRPATLAAFRDAIRAGEDPFGDAFMALRSAEERRPLGATFTPALIVEAMLEWAARRAHDNGAPARVMDPGVGSARYLVAAGRRFGAAALVGVELDPAAAVLGRAHLAVAGLGGRAQVTLADFRAADLGAVSGSTFYVGNPPYVRHHQITPTWKAWLVKRAATLGLEASQLAGLHVYFFLKTALGARDGDAGTFITAAEWLDVNYGRLVRELFLGRLGGQDVLVLDAAVRAFPDAATTAAITTFVVGDRPASVRLHRVEALPALAEPGVLGSGHPIHRQRLESAPRWTPLLLAPRETRDGYLELGELCRVHRGAVTGANAIWVTAGAIDLPERVLFPSVTRARELFAAGDVLADTQGLRRVIDLPTDLDVFDGAERKSVDRFLRAAKRRGAADGYIARHRPRWWSVGLREAPPILATYMARRPPAFVRNVAGARYINIAHGLYPRQPLSAAALHGLAAYLSRSTTLGDGRTYAGGLTKFEPREMERLLVPHPDVLPQFCDPITPDPVAAAIGERSGAATIASNVRATTAR